MALPRPASPRALLADLRAFAGQRPKHQWIAGAVAILMPVILIYGFYRDGQTNMKLPEQIIYAESWTGARTDEEIKATQKERQAQREALQAERQRQYQELERRLGMK
jgi:hypothetical protein